jgi:secernin
VLSDHYEDTFLAGPLFNLARPDFLTLCMHDHPAGFTWGNTAASMVAVLPEAGEPFMWWAATTPCASIYLPVSVMAPDRPAVLAKAGTQHGAGPNPERAAASTYSTDSYWWTFQRLLETDAGDDLGSTYRERQPAVRNSSTRFNSSGPKKLTKCLPTPLRKTGRSSRKTAPLKRYRPHASSSKNINAMHRRHWLTGRR